MGIRKQNEYLNIFDEFIVANVGQGRCWRSMEISDDDIHIWVCSRPFPGVCFQMSPQIAYMNPLWLHLIFLHFYVFPNVSSLWEYFDLQGPWRKVLTDLKKSLYTLQADPEKSRDFMLKNPGILIDWKSRDPVRAWW